MKLCKDCKHSKQTFFKGIMCAHPDHVSPVDGTPDTACIAMRYKMGACDKEGKFWEAK